MSTNCTMIMIVDAKMLDFNKICHGTLRFIMYVKIRNIKYDNAMMAIKYNAKKMNAQKNSEGKRNIISLVMSGASFSPTLLFKGMLFVWPKKNNDL